MKTKQITTAAIAAAVLCLSAYISIPLGFTPVPLTLQTLAIGMIAILLSPSASFLTVLVYILIGAVGIPVFSGGTGGVGKLVSPTGGYIFAFIIAAPVMSLTKGFFTRLFGRITHNRRIADILGYSVNGIVIGMTIIYLIGSIYMKFMLKKSFAAVLAAAVIPFIPLDIVKCIAAAIICVPILKVIEK